MTPDSQEVVARFSRRYAKQSRAFSRLDRTIAPVVGTPQIARPSSLAVPSRLLICNYGHLGDMLILLSLLPALKVAFPNVELGILCGSWNKALVEREPLLTRVHYLDHWYQVRDSSSRAQKIARYARGSRRVLRELKEVGYDTAIDNRLWFPNAIPLLWRAGIPVRVGYDRLGFTPLLTDVVPFEYDDALHERDYQAAPLACLPIDRSLLDEVPERWLQSDGNGLDIVMQHMGEAAPSRYVVLHPGASTEVRNWTEDGWVGLAQKAIAADMVPVLTGLGPEQDALTARIASRVPGTVSLCSKISWRELVAVIAGAQTVYSVETSVGHLAGALGIPVVAIYGGMHNPRQWKPAGRRVALVTHDLPCNPCFQPDGCEHMSCLRGITVDQVWSAGERIRHM